MYHPTRGGVRGGRDQFSWDDVKVDKHRENYLGHSIKAPVGRWQKGKDLNWYARDKKSGKSDADALKEEIRRVKEEEEQAMREALGLAPKRSTQPQAHRLDKHELSELVKRGSTVEDLGEGHAEAARVSGLGFSRMPRPWEDPSSLTSNQEEASPKTVKADEPLPSPTAAVEDESDAESRRKRQKREEKGREKHEKRQSRDSDDKRRQSRNSDNKRRQSRDSDEKRRHRKDKQKRRHDSDSD